MFKIGAPSGAVAVARLSPGLTHEGVSPDGQSTIPPGNLSGQAQQEIPSQEGAAAAGGSNSSSSVHSGQVYEHSQGLGEGGRPGRTGRCDGSSPSSVCSVRGGVHSLNLTHSTSPLAMPGWQREADGVVRYVSAGVEFGLRQSAGSQMSSSTTSKPELDSLSTRLQGMNEALSALSSLP